MLATRQCLNSVRRSCRRPPHLIPRLRPPRTFTTAPLTAQKPSSWTDEEYVRTVREEWGNNLPEGLLTQSEFTVYQRYYGQPARMLKEGETANWEVEEPEAADVPGTVTLQNKDGVGIEVYEEEPEDGGGGRGDELENITVDVNTPREARAYEQLQRDVEDAYRRGRRGEEAEEEQEEQEEEEEVDDDGTEDDVFMRTHPLTSVGRFATFPYTIIVPPSVQLPTLDRKSVV